MKNIVHYSSARAVAAGGLALALALPANALTIADTPLFLTSGGKANVLVVLDNSNSMDEKANGEAAGSNSPDSKSEIARSVVRGLVTSYTNKINMGLMAYQQNDPLSYSLHNSPYDVSYNPANYDPAYSGIRDSLTKKYRVVNPTDTGNFIYYNIALPFYASSDQGNAFCYSTTADFDNGSETYPTGFVADNYRCFSTKTGTSDTLPTSPVSPEVFSSTIITASETAAGYGGSMVYAGGFYPTDSDIAQDILDFGRFNTWFYVSPAWFTNSSPGRGYLHTPIQLLDSTQAATLNAKLACNIPGTPSPCAESGIKNAGLTPIEGTLLTAKDYFAGDLKETSEGFTSTCYPLPTSCGKNFVVLVTDGMPSTAADGTVLTDPAAAITKAAEAAATLKKAGVETYVVGFALPYGVDAATLNTIAASGGTGTAHIATDPTTLTNALDAIFADIEEKTSSAAAVATNSTRLNTETMVYQARFDSVAWSGQIVAYPLKGDGSLGTEKWDTDTSGKIPAHAARNIFTWNGSAQVVFKEANFASLSTVQQNALKTPNCSSTLTGDPCGKARMEWLRGDATQEEKNGGPFRDRVKPLGDVVNSDPRFVGAEDFGYINLVDADGGGQYYIDFLTWSQGRDEMLYVGANDGMLHALNANTGTEKFAYVPSEVYQNLSKLTDPAYAHKYFVDGPTYAEDARIGPSGEGAPKHGWRTVLVGTLGAGGRSVYALDITDPGATDFGKPLWEFTHAELGYVMGAPEIVKLKSGEWAAVFGNGYNSTGTTAKLFIVNLATGALIQMIDTNSSTSNGLSAPAVYDGDNNRIIGDYSGSSPTDAIYAGDLLGNVWKFGNTSTTSGNWEVTYKSGSTFVPLFSAKDSGGKAQPITAPLEIGDPPAGTSTGIMVYFGTGSYMSTDDRTNKDVQSLYGIWDSGTRISTTNRSDLEGQTIDYEITEFGKKLRVVSDNPVIWTGSQAKRGWYLDLISPPLLKQGERVVSTPLLRHGRAIFTTLIPSTAVCGYGGTSWLMELNATTGGRLDYSVFDLKKDKDSVLFNEEDFVSVVIDGKTVKVPASGVESEVGITKAPAVISAGGVEYKVASGTDTSGVNKGVQVTTEKGVDGKSRTSWRQLFSEDK